MIFVLKFQILFNLSMLLPTFRFYLIIMSEA